MNHAARAVLFDLDGTLINTFHLYMESFRRTLEPHFNRRLSDAEIMAFNPHSEQRLLLELIQEMEFTPYFEHFLTFYSALHDALFAGPYDGVLDMLRTLQGQGYLLGVVTGKSRDAWRITATRMEDEGFEDLFHIVLTDDDVQAPKPSPEGLLLVLDALEIQPTQAVFIGDSLLDREAAREAGILFGAALWAMGRNGQATFAQPVGPDDGGLIFRQPAQLLDWLREQEEREKGDSPE